MKNKVLCVCKGNSDRSPLMAAVLGMFLKNAGLDVVCESAGILDVAAKGGCASPFGVVSAKRIGLDISNHNKRQIDSLNLKEYDLFVCVDEAVAARVLELGVPIQNIVNVQVDNPWPSQFQIDHDVTAEKIMAAMYRVVTRFFSN
jgi:protein-tyrosine-phosphatase